MTEPTYITDDDGTQRWKVGHRLSRLDGPAYIAGRQKEWWVNGKLHRLDGPAIIFPTGRRDYWVNHNHVLDNNELLLFDSEEGRMILILKYGSP